MTDLAWILALLAAATALPAAPSAAVARVRALTTGAYTPRAHRQAQVVRLRGGAGLLGFGGAAAFGVTAQVGFGANPPVLPALAGLVIGGAGGTLVSRSRESRRRRRQESALVESVAALAADLRAGQRPEDALAAAGAGAVSGPHLQSAAVAAVWAVSARSGAPAASVLDRVERDLQAKEEQRREVAAQLAGSRSTAALLSVLPVLGVGLGAAMGAQPLHVLLGPGPGQIALVVGAGLDALGLLWTARIVAAAGGEP